MRLSNRTLMAALVMVILGTQLAYAQKKADAASSKPDDVVVLSTAVDRANQTLTVRGTGFNAQTLVWCETYLMTVISVTDSQLVVFLPAGVPDGTHLLTVARGNGEKDRDSFHMNVGTPGQGPAGPTGPKGEMGPAGPKGAAGATGPKGETGVAGPKGEAGAKGDTGAVGPKGEAGAVGPQGATGPSGPVGFAGPAGPVGPTGLAGATGPAGQTGPAGPQGEPGPVGPAGPAGAAGATGPAGPVGPKGDTGMVGPQGEVGPAGAAGAQGPQGAAGAAGPKGDTGAVGPQGPQGAIGATGATGAQGPAGPAGPQGPAGLSAQQVVSTGLLNLTLAGNATTSLPVTCPTGKRVFGGGYESNTTADVHTTASYPLNQTQWTVTLHNAESGPVAIQFRVYAVCATSN